MGDGTRDPCELPEAHTADYSRRLCREPGPAFVTIHDPDGFGTTAIPVREGMP